MKYQAIVGLAGLVVAHVSVTPVLGDSQALFPAQASELTLKSSYAVPVLGDSEHYFSSAVAYGYYFTRGVAVVPQVRGHFVDTEQADAVGTDFSLLVRWQVWEQGRWSVYIDGGPGLSYFDHRIPPPDGTRFNFVLQGGLGTAYRLGENLFLIVGAELLHFSNAGLQGSDRHPGSNAVAGYVGVTWRF
jgi:hypothetical protein